MLTCHLPCAAFCAAFRDLLKTHSTNPPAPSTGIVRDRIAPGRRGVDREATRYSRRFSSCMFNASPRISLVSTSKLAGVPASSVFSPLTMLS